MSDVCPHDSGTWTPREWRFWRLLCEGSELMARQLDQPGRTDGKIQFRGRLAVVHREVMDLVRSCEICSGIYAINGGWKP